VCRCSSSRRCGLAALVGRMETDEVFNFSQYEKHHRYILYNPDHTGNLPSSCSASSSTNDVTCHMIQNSGCAGRQSAAALPPLSSPLFSSLLSALSSSFSLPLWLLLALDHPLLVPTSFALLSFPLIPARLFRCLAFSSRLACFSQSVHVKKEILPCPASL
jgi:hypothetical protein